VAFLVTTPCPFSAEMLDFHATVGSGQHATLLSVKARHFFVVPLLQ
jgi:hypothetical protein